MRFFKLLHDNKLLVHYVTIVIVIIGVMSLYKIQREARPNVNFNRVAVAVAYPGASPRDIEELVVDPIEEKLQEVDGIEEFRSVSFNGAGSISIVVDDEYPDPDEVVDEIRRRVGEVKDFPAEVSDPVISEIKAENIPVLRLALFGSLPPLQMKMEVEKLKDYILTFPDVQSVGYTGLTDLQLKVKADPQKLDEFDLTLMEVISGLRSWAKQKPGGLLETKEATTNLTIGEDYNSKEALGNFVVRSNGFGKGVRLSDIARVEYGTEKSQSASLFGDQDAILLTIVKKPFADAITTARTVREGLVKYAPNLPDSLQFKLYTDESKRVTDRINIVTNNALFGLVLVLIMLIFFLDWRSAVVTSIGIPIAVFGGIALIYFQGNTMNSLVLVGMIIVLGMLVDDAIVICENIYYHLESGLSPKEAAIKGAGEIAIPVTATVMTTILAFFPILFMKEIMGQFLRVIPLTVIAMLLVSLFEALLILPVHADEIMRSGKAKKQGLFRKVERVYESYMQWTMRHRWLILLMVAAVIGSSMYQGSAIFKKFTLFPATGLNGLSVRVELPRNTPLDETRQKIKDLNEVLISVSEDSFDSIYSTIGSVTTGGAGGSRQSASNLGAVNIVFTTDPTFTKNEKRVVSNIRRVTREFSQKTGIKTSVTIDRPGPPIGKPIQYQITSRDTVEAKKIADLLREKFGNIEGVHSLETDLDADSLKYRLILDNDAAVSEGVDPRTISQTIFATATGIVTNEILLNNEKIEILATVDSDNEQSLKDILQLKIRNNRGQSMKLYHFVQVEKEAGPSSIQRLNGVKTVTLFGEVDEEKVSGKEANAKVRPYLEELKETYTAAQIVTGGGEKDRLNALSDTMRLYLLAILLIFMTISLSFKSLIYPFLVLVAIPLGLCGVVWSLTLHNQPPSLMALIGMVGLSGVVVNVSIILLSLIKTRLAEGAKLKDAVVEASVRRLRPILITTVTTLTGLMPTIYGFGGMDHFVQPIALVLGWGLFVATFLTVFALPALLSYFTFLEKKS